MSNESFEVFQPIMIYNFLKINFALRGFEIYSSYIVIIPIDIVDLNQYKA